MRAVHCHVTTRDDMAAASVVMRCCGMVRDAMLDCVDVVLQLSDSSLTSKMLRLQCPHVFIRRQQRF